MKRVDLNGNWILNRRGEKENYEAVIPGTVLSTLVKENVIANPYVRMNEYQTRDLFWEDYVFQRKFYLNEVFFKEERIELVCEGLDTLADIYINEKMVFHADNMHRTWRVPIKQYLIYGENIIRIEFLSVLRYIENYQYKENKETHFVAAGAIKGNQLVRKAHSMFGWDWGPQLIDAGIFRDIYLEGWSFRRIEDVQICQIHQNDFVKLHVTATFSEDGKAEKQRIKVTVRERDTKQIVVEAVKNIDHNIVQENDFRIKSPKLWWPNGYGEQPLYEMEITLINQNGRIVQTVKKTIGLRKINVSRKEDSWGREFVFQVNGVKIFAMGANYIPEDCIYSWITKERQEHLLESAKRANFNCIRIWGGGYYPSDAFYELCDEKGIIIWQDLMFACNVYDATDAFIKNCEKEIEDNVKRLRHHPCLGLWCGNNEIESAWDHWEEFKNETMQLRADYIKLFEYVVPKVMERYAGDVFFWPSSPSAGGCFENPDNENDGDSHYWDVWHGQKPFTDYRKYYFRFCSEFGFQSFPSIKTVRAFTDSGDRNIFSRVMESHQKNNAANGKILYYMSENFRYPSGFDDLLYVSQILQGMAIQYGVEHWRRHRGRCMGALYWQFNDNWPVTSWSSIDYFGRWKALQYMASRFFAPLTASLLREEKKISFFVENETAEKVEWSGEILLKNMDCKVMKKCEMKGTTNGFCSEKIMQWQLDNICKENVFVEGKIVFQNGREVNCVETFLPYKHLELKKHSIEVWIEEKEEDFIIYLKSDVFAPFVELDFDDVDVLFSDNYFHMTGDTKEIRIKKGEIKNGHFLNADDMKNRLKIRSIKDTYTCD
ncbi:MAG: glycosyl hydrolase 2 galactose-binding domain-containing protein [Lachnospiraceae bacterium]